MYKLLTANSDMSRLHNKEWFSQRSSIQTIWLSSLMQIEISTWINKPPVQNILIRSGLFHTWFTPETCLKCMQIKNFTCGTRLNMPDRKFTPISCMKNFTPDSCLKFFTPVHMWKLSRIPTMPHCESTNHIYSFKHTLNQSHPSKQLWFSDKSNPPFWRLIVKHAMDICYIFLSSNEYIKKR